MWTFREIIGLWPTVSAMALDVGVGERTGFSWWQRDSIPSDRFASVVRAAAKRGYVGVTADTLAIIAERRRISRDGHADNDLAAA